MNLFRLFFGYQMEKLPIQKLRKISFMYLETVYFTTFVCPIQIQIIFKLFYHSKTISGYLLRWAYLF